MKYAYDTLKNNAKRRGKEFTITFEEFEKFAVKVSYLRKKGIHAHSYHIDRKDETKGYVPGNLRLLTNAENVRKYFDWMQKRIITTKPSEQNPNVPF